MSLLVLKLRPMILTYRYRLLPTRQQHRALEAILESQRQIYNAALQERRDAYRLSGVTRTYIDQCKGLTELRQDAEFSGLPVRLQRATLKRLEEAYRGFFRRAKNGEKPGFPRFRARAGSIASVSASLRESHSKPGEFASRECRGRSAFTCIGLCPRRQLSRAVPSGARPRMARRLRRKSADAPNAYEWRAVGVDLGINLFAALSDGGFIPSLKAARRAEYLHQASARLVRDYDVIALEALNVEGLARSALAKDVHDASWAKFISYLTYKAARAGARIIEVDPQHTTQDCSGCGMVVPKELGERRHECPHCGLSIDRDLNAARNILDRAGLSPGLRNVAGCGMRAGENLSLQPWSCQAAVGQTKTLPRAEASPTERCDLW